MCFMYPIASYIRGSIPNLSKVVIAHLNANPKKCLHLKRPKSVDMAKVGYVLINRRQRKRLLSSTSSSAMQHHISAERNGRGFSIMVMVERAQSIIASMELS